MTMTTVTRTNAVITSVNQCPRLEATAVTMITIVAVATSVMMIIVAKSIRKDTVRMIRIVAVATFVIVIIGAKSITCWMWASDANVIQAAILTGKK